MYKKIKKIVGLLFIIGAAFFVNPPSASSQCPMCRMTVESNLKNGGTAGKGLNQGILFMLLTPYLIIGTVGYVWYKNRRTEKKHSYSLKDIRHNGVIERDDII